MNNEDFNKFYEAYNKYAEEKRLNENNKNIFDFESLLNERKKAKKEDNRINSQQYDDSIGFKFKLSFGIKPSDSFVDKMDARLDRVQKALDDLRGELYLYPDL